MKMKSRTKKILVLSIMVVLLVATGVLNFVLNNKLNSVTDDVGTAGDGAVTQTFFAAARSDRESTRESEFLYLDAIINSETSSDSAKTNAEEQKMALLRRMDKELALETLIKGKGFEDVIVTIGDGGVTVVVDTEELTVEQSNQILAIIVTETEYKATEVRVLSYV